MRVSLGVALVAAGLVYGYTHLLASTCSGQETLRVFATQATANHLTTFAAQWGKDEPATADGTCARVEVQAWDSAQVAAELATGWRLPDQAPPDVWVPASTAWVRVAAASEVAEPMLPADPPSIARSQTVLAMPAPMAEELRWPEPRLAGEEVRWEALLDEFGDGDGDWARYDRPEWGRFRFGMANPAKDTAALLALTAVVGAAEEGAETPPALQRAVALRRMLDEDAYYETTEQLLTALAERDREDSEAALEHVSAFPALEHEVFAYNRRNPRVPLAAVYPVDGTVEADYPYLTLVAEWVSDRKREIAGMFLDYVRSEGPQAALRDAGFRGVDGEPGPGLTAENGLLPEAVALPHAELAPEAVTLTIDRWTALTSRLNLLLIFDAAAEPPAGAEPWLEQARAATLGVVDLLDGDDRFGLWQPALAEGEGFRSVVPIGGLGDILEDGVSRRDHVQAAVADLAPPGDAGLDDTVQAAFDTVLASYDEDAANLVVVITDGTDSPANLSSTELLDHLRDAPSDGQRVRVVTIGLGPAVDMAVLAEISKITGGQSRHSADGSDLPQAVRAAVFGSVSIR